MYSHRGYPVVVYRLPPSLVFRLVLLVKVPHSWQFGLNPRPLGVLHPQTRVWLRHYVPHDVESLETLVAQRSQCLG